ncbi:MAG TPA: hypothetical protein PKA96_02990 [Candidatus Paceibacterota bacterium]|nr:hypothetical protein [Candidatus Paceibacterota bacterium]
MKKSKIVLFFAALTVLVTGIVYSAPNSVLLAKEIANNEIDAYSISAEYYVPGFENVPNQRHQMRAIYKPHVGIVWLEINGHLFVDYGDKPRMGLPRPMNSQMKEFSAAVCAYSAGECVMSGWAWHEELLPNQSVDFIMNLFQKRHFIRWTNSTGNNNVSIRIHDYYGGVRIANFDFALGGFVIYLPPGYESFSYEIVTGTGNLVDVGTVFVSGGNQTSLSSDGNPVNFVLPDGIKMIDLTRGHVSLTGLTTDSNVSWDNGFVSGAVFVIKKESHQELQAILTNPVSTMSAVIDVYEVDQYGQLVLLQSFYDSGDYIWIVHNSPVTKIILVLREVKSPNSKFDLHIYVGGKG